MTNKIKVTGTINSWGHNSIDSAEVFFNKHIEDCSCGGSYSFSAMLQMEQIKEGNLVDDCATIECGNCYSVNVRGNDQSRPRSGGEGWATGTIHRCTPTHVLTNTCAVHVLILISPDFRFHPVS